MRHVLVAHFGGGLVAVKAVGVLHDELAPAHQAKARTAFVAEFGLDLVHVFWQLLVTADILAHHVGDDFLAGRLDHEVAAVPVLDAQHLRAHLVKAAGFLPEFGGLDHWHGHFDGASAVHFFAHDGLDLADDAQAHRHVVVDTGAQFFDQAGAHHQLMADDFGVSGGFLEGGNKELGGFHGLFFWVWALSSAARRAGGACAVHNGLSLKNLRFDYA